MSVTNILTQLQLSVTKKHHQLELHEDELEEMFGPTFANQYSRDGDAVSDVPNVVDTPYDTHMSTPVPKGKKAGSNYVLGEADGIDTEKETTTVADKAIDAAGDTDGNAQIDDTGAGADADMNIGDVGGDNMDLGMGMDEQEEEKSPTDLGRIYELKKIYSRLTSIESYLANESNLELLEIRNYVSQGIELFEIVSSNFDSYKGKMNEIIVMYYKFILEVYNSVKTFYGKQKKSGDK